MINQTFNRMKLRHLCSLVTAFVLLAGSAFGQRAERIPEPGAYVVPNASLPFITGSTVYRQGGFSGLFHAGGNEFWVLTDRGPNVDFNGNVIFLVPDFQPRMFKIRLNPDGVITIVDSILLTRTGGGPTSGLANPAPYNTGQISYDIDRNVLSDDDWGFDTEGILIAPDGTFWFCEEYAPGIAQVAPNGEIIRRVRPQPTGGLPDILKRRRPNRGCEGIVMTPNGKIYTIVQSGMENSFSGTNDDDEDASEQTELLRLVEFDPSSGATRMFAYMMDAGYPRSGGGIVRRRDIKIGDMAAVNDNEILILEHAERGSGNVKKVYKLDLRGATAITQEVFEVSPGVFKSLEELTRAQVSSVAGITPVGKELVLDLRNPGDGNPTWPLEADKPEGLTILNSTTISVGNDNDFGVLSPEEDGEFIFTGKQLHTLVYRLEERLDFRLGPQADIRQELNQVTPGSPWFVNDNRCVGEDVSSLPMSITNTGTHDVVIYGADFFQIDTTIVQGNPAHPLRRTPQGDLIAATEYSITETPGTQPSSSAVPPVYPIVIAPGDTWSFHLNFTPERRGRRFARAFIHTNVVGVFGEDPYSSADVEGLLSIDLFGQGFGGLLDTRGHYVFKPTEPGSFRDTAIVLHNRGECGLRLAQDFLSIDAGDVEDFHILSTLPNSTIDNRKNYVIPAGAKDSIVIRFTPNQQGSRRATITLRTNDSSIVLPAITERGTAYIDLYGVGIANVRVHSTKLPPAVVGGAPSIGTVVVENTSITPVDILQIDFADDDDGELAGQGWPTFPKSIAAGESLKLVVVFTPKAGSTSGMKTRKIAIRLSNGNVVGGIISVFVGTRLLSVTPASLFDNAQIAAGDIVHETMVITNSGTLPVALGALTITGTDAANYLLGPIPRSIIEPGQSEFIEVTFKPSTSGPSSAEISIPSDATNGPHSIMLGGMSSGTALPGGSGSPFGVGRITGRTDVTAAGILRLQPSPASHEVRVHYAMQTEGTATISLHDLTGRLVRLYDQEVRGAGQHSRTIDLHSLAAGLYYVRMTSASGTFTAPLTVTR